MPWACAFSDSDSSSHPALATQSKPRARNAEAEPRAGEVHSGTVADAHGHVEACLGLRPVPQAPDWDTLMPGCEHWTSPLWDATLPRRIAVGHQLRPMRVEVHCGGTVPERWILDTMAVDAEFVKVSDKSAKAQMFGQLNHKGRLNHWFRTVDEVRQQHGRCLICKQTHFYDPGKIDVRFWSPPCDPYSVLRWTGGTTTATKEDKGQGSSRLPSRHGAYS